MKEGYRPSTPESSPSAGEITRRGLLKSLGALGVAGALSGSYKLAEHYGAKQLETLPIEGERFFKELSGYVGLVNLRHDQVVFVDEYNVPIGEPINYKDADIIEEQVNDKGEVVLYRYTPGVPNQYGVYFEPPALEWRKKMIAKLEADPVNAGRTVAGHYNVALIFKEALAFTDEPELVAGINNGIIKTYGDIVASLAGKDTLNEDLSVYREVGKPVTRLEYIQKHLKFSDKVPAIVQSSLKMLVPGICAQESTFHNGLVSKTGAKGIFQFMPDTWGEYVKNDEKSISSLIHQVEIVNELLSDMYTRLFRHADTEALARARQAFPDQETFLRDFIVPTLINSFNAGPARLAAAIDLFFTPQRKIAGQGIDVFLEMVDFAEQYDEVNVIAGNEPNNDKKLMRKYDVEARQYVPRVYAHAIAIANRA